MPVAHDSGADSRLAIVESRVHDLTARVDDYHARLKPIEAANGEPRATERKRVDGLEAKTAAIETSIHALDLRFTSLSVRVQTVVGLGLMLAPMLTALLVRWIGK